MKARAALEDTGWCVQVFWGEGEHCYQRLYVGCDIGPRGEEFARLVENALNAYAESQGPPEPGSDKAAKIINEDARTRLGMSPTPGATPGKE